MSSSDEPTLSIDIIAGAQFGSLLKENSNSNVASSFVCAVKFNNKEIGRTEPSTDSHDPGWLSRITSPIEGHFDGKQCENNRPFFFEYLEVHVFDTAKSVTDRIGECRVPLIDVGTNKWYKIVKPFGSSGSHDLETAARLQISLEINGELNSFIYTSDPRQLQLSEVFPPSLPYYRHLYLDLTNDWAPTHLVGLLGLPGPRLGEVIEDMHGNVEWRVVSGSNCFGDKYHIQCTGFLVITDLRVLFLPNEIQSPMWAKDISIKRSSDKGLTMEELIAVRKMTYQVPIGSIQDCKVSYIDMHTSTIALETKDGFRAEFLVRRPPQGHRRQAMQRSNNPGQSVAMNRNGGAAGTAAQGTTIPRRRESRPSLHLAARGTALPVPINFASGLETYCVSASVWCTRVADVIMFMLREDRCWIKWAQYIKLTCDEMQGLLDTGGSNAKDPYTGNTSTNNSANKTTSATASAAAAWVKKARQRISEDEEYSRLRVHDGEWVISSLNCSYQLCSTYPQSLVLPGSLSDEDIRGAASERSKGRLCVLSWLHPTSKVPLCRSAQPNAGMSGANCDADKKACLAIKSACPTGLPLRIADARPKLNANANSLQGKGFENVSFFGGPSVASIAFLDVENIHVMRSSLAKLREGWFGVQAHSAQLDSDFVQVNFSMFHVFELFQEMCLLPVANVSFIEMQSSKWLTHISIVLRGAVGMAESILLGYPVLVHCSDGWDRTAQLSSLTQVCQSSYICV
jgi:hypothetical protein